MLRAHLLEFYHLRSFVAVAQTGNLTQAAKRLYTTPPAVSAHIKSLEEELSTRLFSRSAKGMALTEKGEILLKKAQVTLDSAIDLVNVAATNQQEIIGSFRLGINVPIEQVKLDELLQKLQENCPGISLDVQLISTGDIIKAIRSQQLDGGYIFGDIPEDLFVTPITRHEITTIAPLNIDSSQLKTKADLAKQRWIKMGEYCPFDQILTKKLGKNLVSSLIIRDDMTRLALVKKAQGLSFIEKSSAVIAANEGEVQVIPLLDFTLMQSFVIERTRQQEPLVNVVLAEVSKMWSESHSSANCTE